MDKQNIRIKLRAYDHKVLDQSTIEIVNTAKTKRLIKTIWAPASKRAEKNHY